MADRNDRESAESGWGVLADVFNCGGDLLFEGVVRAVLALFDM